MKILLKEHGDRLNGYAILSICGRGDDNQRALHDVEATAGYRRFASLLIMAAEAEDEACRHQLEAFGQELSRSCAGYDRL